MTQATAWGRSLELWTMGRLEKTNGAFGAPLCTNHSICLAKEKLYRN